jgi:hypothetical protein
MLQTTFATVLLVFLFFLGIHDGAGGANLKSELKYSVKHNSLY